MRKRKLIDCRGFADAPPESRNICHLDMGGDSAPPPDPALIAAQIRSMGYQDQAIQTMISNANTMLPLQKAQMQFGLDTSRTAWEQSQADRAYALDRRGELTGLQDRMIADANAFDAEVKGEEYAAQGVADVGMQAEQARQAMTRQQQRMGVNPASGKSLAMQSQMGIAEAAAKATAANKLRAAARAEGYGLTDRASNALAGYPAMGMSTTGSGAGFGANGLTLVNNAAAGMNSGLSSVVSGAGALGSNATGMYNAQANYATNTANSQGEMFGTLLGAGSQLGAAMIMSSDRRLKEDVVRVGTDEKTGLSLYEFSYKTEPGVRYRGVMADEVKSKFPQAVREGADGYMRVDYGMLGIQMQRVGG